MNVPQALYDDLRAAGYTLTVSGGKLWVSPKEALQPDDREVIAAHRDALMAVVMGTYRPPVLPVQPILERSPEGLSPLADVMTLCAQADVLAIDFETTGLDHRQDRVRLLSVSDGSRALVLDCWRESWQDLLPMLAGKVLLAHNMAFDAGWLWQAGLRDLPDLLDTWLLAELLEAGTLNRCGLAACCERYLGYPLAKDEQTSDWRQTELRPEQVEYARKDAAVLLPLFQQLTLAIREAGLERVAEIEMRALPFWVWLCQSGVPFQRAAWGLLADEAELGLHQWKDALDALAPQPEQQTLFGTHAWDWGSPAQVKEVLHILGYPVDSTDDDHLATISHPIAEAVRSFRNTQTSVTRYGRNWDACVATDGRIYPQWRQLGGYEEGGQGRKRGTCTGRTSCDSPNCQNVPRDVRYRRCIMPAPGKVLVKADYGQLQLRIAAKMSGDARMLEVYRTGGDIHTETARALLGKHEVTKADRQVSKSCNFGLLFGMSAGGLRGFALASYGVHMTADEAARHREAFFKSYPGLARWHRETRQKHASETRSTMGRRRILHDKAPDTFRLNSPVQGDESDGMKQALGLLWKSRHKLPPGTLPVLVVHDEVVLECPEADAPHVAEWLKACMVAGMEEILDPVPCEVDVSIRPTWGG